MYLFLFCSNFRFIILKAVRRDLIPSLPLPRRMIDYLNTPHYYSEQLVDVEDSEEKEIADDNVQQTETEGSYRSNYVLMQNGGDTTRQS